MVVWVVPDPATTLSDHAIEFYGPEVAHRYGLAGRSDDFGSRLWHEFVVGDKDLVVEKSASSAFFPGLSPLPDLLQDRGVDTVLISGTVTNVCCESSARDASTLGYRVIAVADAMAGVDDESHNASLRTIYRSFGDVRPTSEVVALFEGSQRALDVSSDS
jgi:nicotinamidase-related amidase